MADRAQREAETRGKGRMTEPAKHHSYDYKKWERIASVVSEVDKVLDHREARTDQGPVDEAIGDVVELVSQHKKEQQQAQTLDRLFSDARVQALQDRAHYIAGVRSQRVL